jgi:hypothetical protein
MDELVLRKPMTQSMSQVSNYNNKVHQATDQTMQQQLSLISLSRISYMDQTTP